MLRSCRGRASALAQDPVKARDVLGRDPADALATSGLLTKAPVSISLAISARISSLRPAWDELKSMNGTVS